MRKYSLEEKFTMAMHGMSPNEWGMLDKETRTALVGRVKSGMQVSGITLRDPDVFKKAIEIPRPLVMPFGMEITSDMVRDVWNTYIKPDQDAGNPQSVETRMLMAILRSVGVGLEEYEEKLEKEKADNPSVKVPAGEGMQGASVNMVIEDEVSERESPEEKSE